MGTLFVIMVCALKHTLTQTWTHICARNQNKRRSERKCLLYIITPIHRLLMAALAEVVTLCESVCVCVRMCAIQQPDVHEVYIYMCVCKATVSPPGFVEPAFIQLWQIVSQHLLMAGLVIIRKAINTPSLFNWFELMSLSVLSHSPSPSLSLCCGLIFLAHFLPCLHV